MYGYVYLTTNLLNGMKYIGKRTSDVFCPTYFGSGIRLKNAVGAYGKINFRVELLEAVEDRAALEEAEKRLIAQHDAVGSELYYNLAPGGPGGTLYTDRSRSSVTRREAANLRYAQLEELLRSRSQYEVAEMLGIDQSAVAQRIKEHSVKVSKTAAYQSALLEKRRAAAEMAHEARRKLSAQLWSPYDLAAMYETMTQAQMAEIIGVTQARVSQKLKEMGIKKKKGIRKGF
jgi:predicted transcriptional regulator